MIAGQVQRGIVMSGCPCAELGTGGYRLHAGLSRPVLAHAHTRTPPARPRSSAALSKGMQTAKEQTDVTKRLLCLQGTISIMAHSLGSVLMWDVLCNQPQLAAHLHELPPSIQPVPFSARPSAPAWNQPQPTFESTPLDKVCGKKDLFACCHGRYGDKIPNIEKIPNI